MMKPLYLLAGLSLAVPCSLLLGHGKGILPGEVGVPRNLNTGFPGCGAVTCHNPFPNFNVKLDILTAPSLRKGSGKVPITVKVSGANTQQTKGGFSMEASAGVFADAGTTTVRVGKTANNLEGVTHFDSQSRQWTFDYTPPAATGLVQLYATANAVNGDGRNSGDAWGWYGPDSSTPGTPYRMFVNDTAVFPFGESCGGNKAQFSPFRFKPVLGIAKNAAVGSTFQTEVYNVPGGTATITIFGVSNAAWGPIPLPLSLKPFGADGCFLRVSMDLLQVAITTGSGQGGGVGKTTWQIPNIAGLRGADVFFQAMTIDQGANGLDLSFSHGLRANVQ